MAACHPNNTVVLSLINGALNILHRVKIPIGTIYGICGSETLSLLFISGNMYAERKEVSTLKYYASVNNISKSSDIHELSILIRDMHVSIETLS